MSASAARRHGPEMTRRRDLILAWLLPGRWRFSGQTNWNGRAWVRQYRRPDGSSAPPWLPRWPRWINALYARAFGYFWLPCELCGRPYGGHEWRNGNHLVLSRSLSWGVCRACGPEARRRNDRFSP